MKALSVRQPWVYAILQAGKRIENRRGWAGCALRGPILIHAGKTCTKAEHEEAALFMRDLGVVCPPWLPPRERHHVGLYRPALSYGAIVGAVTIAGEIRSEQDMALYETAARGQGQRRWWAGGFALVLRDVEVFEVPVPYPAQLNFFDVRGVYEGAARSRVDDPVAAALPGKTEEVPC